MKRILVICLMLTFLICLNKHASALPDKEPAAADSSSESISKEQIAMEEKVFKKMQDIIFQIMKAQEKYFKDNKAYAGNFGNLKMTYDNIPWDTFSNAYITGDFTITLTGKDKIEGLQDYSDIEIIAKRQSPDYDYTISRAITNYYICASSNESTRKLLKKLYCDLNDESYTPFHTAAKNLFFEDIKALVAKKADINAITSEGKTPLAIVMEKLRSSMPDMQWDKGKLIALYLVSSGAETFTLDRTQRDNLREFAQPGWKNRFTEEVKFVNDLEYTPFMMTIAVKQKSPDLEKIIREEPEINAVNKYGQNALFYTIAFNNPKLTQLLIDYGAKANIEDIYGNTPADQAADYGFREIYDILKKALEK